MRICCAISGFSSMLSFTMRTAPLAARTVFSSSGPSCRHGPHHGAQKSTMTGVSNEPSTTSAIKVAVVTSLTGAAAAPPIKGSLGIALLFRIPSQHGRARGRTQAPGRQSPPAGGRRRAGSSRERAAVDVGEVDNPRLVPLACSALTADCIRVS